MSSWDDSSKLCPAELDESLRWRGVSPVTIRVSVGLEDAEDLIEDLRQALS